jgi:DnaK suppressor protein
MLSEGFSLKVIIHFSNKFGGTYHPQCCPTPQKCPRTKQLRKLKGGSMRTTLLKKIRETLEAERETILEQLDAELKSGRDSAFDEGMDTYDVVSEARTKELSAILSEREQSQLQAIEEALQRMADGTYGVCEGCGEEIALERLKALPFTRLCVLCQEEKEKEAKLHHREDEAPSRPRFGLFDIEEENSSLEGNGLAD